MNKSMMKIGTTFLQDGVNVTQGYGAMSLHTIKDTDLEAIADRLNQDGYGFANNGDSVVITALPGAKD